MMEYLIVLIPEKYILAILIQTNTLVTDNWNTSTTCQLWSYTTSGNSRKKAYDNKKT